MLFIMFTGGYRICTTCHQNHRFRKLSRNPKNRVIRRYKQRLLCNEISVLIHRKSGTGTSVFCISPLFHGVDLLSFMFRLITDTTLSLKLESRILICETASRIRISLFLGQTIVERMVCLILSVRYMSFHVQIALMDEESARLLLIINRYIPSDVSQSNP